MLCLGCVEIRNPHHKGRYQKEVDDFMDSYPAAAKSCSTKVHAIHVTVHVIIPWCRVKDIQHSMRQQLLDLHVGMNSLYLEKGDLSSRMVL